MKPSAQSPFAALSPREQKEQWICWQAAHQQDHETEELPELRLPRREETKPHEPLPVSPVRHSQYDAVIRRMKNARCHAQDDHLWD